MIFNPLGFNDLGTCKGIGLIQNIERYILCLCLLLPSKRIIWSEILMRRSWHCAHNGTAIGRARKHINDDVNKFVKHDGHCVIRHPPFLVHFFTFMLIYSSIFILINIFRYVFPNSLIIRSFLLSNSIWLSFLSLKVFIPVFE
jgi:hypothetical protein